MSDNEMDSARNLDELDAVVVGAGISGLYQLYRLREAGLKVRAFEAGPEVGGTWYWNRYPGARCDTESIFYSYSFWPELEQEWTWTERYASQPEILRYLNHVADRFDLRRSITFDTRVTSMVYDETRHRWRLELDSAEIVDAQFVVMASGVLSTPKLAEIPGIESFRGRTFHTSDWPKEGVDFSGQRVAVIGTGSSGIQSIPLIAKDAASLTVFQRTPNFSAPARNRPLTTEEVDHVKAVYPEWRQEQRLSGFGIVAPTPTLSALEVSDEVRRAKYESGWEKGNLVDLVGAYTDILTDKAANDTAADFVRDKISGIVKDPEVAEILSPRSFALGTKRPCLDTDYYETFNLPHVVLVDLRKTPLVELTEKGVRTTEGEYEFDVVVFATGFDAITGTLLSLDIRGKGGLSLRECWAAGPRTYLGVSIAGFPNLFTVTGPFSPSVLSNMVASIEQHVEWITDCIVHLRDHAMVEIAAEPEAEQRWIDHVTDVGNQTLFPTADSWYVGANVPGKPRVFMVYLGGVGVFRQLCDDIATRDYEGFSLTPA